MLAARWLGLDAASGQRFVLATTALCALGYEHDRSEPVIRLWNWVAYPVGGGFWSMIDESCMAPKSAPAALFTLDATVNR